MAVVNRHGVQLNEQHRVRAFSFLANLLLLLLLLLAYPHLAINIEGQLCIMAKLQQTVAGVCHASSFLLMLLLLLLLLAFLHLASTRPAVYHGQAAAHCGACPRIDLSAHAAATAACLFTSCR
jgi:hypothetical protein